MAGSQEEEVVQEKVRPMKQTGHSLGYTAGHVGDFRAKCLKLALQ